MLHKRATTDSMHHGHLRSQLSALGLHHGHAALEATIHNTRTPRPRRNQRVASRMPRASKVQLVASRPARRGSGVRVQYGRYLVTCVGVGLRRRRH